MHRFQGVHGIEYRFTFAGRHACGIEIYDIRRQAFGSNFKGGSCAGAGLEEQIDYGFAAQQGDFFNFPLAKADEAVGEVENLGRASIG